MKMKLPIFVVCLMFTGSVMAEGVPPAAPAHKTKTRRHKKKKKAVKAPAAPATTAAAPEKQASEKPVLAEASPAAAAEPKGDSFQGWLEGIKKRLQRSETRSNKVVSVAAVRGDEVADAAPLYWKGKKAEAKDIDPEQKDFESAIDTALTGDKIAAKEKLQSFLLAYPKSAFAPDAQETLKRLEVN